ncbi:hypothetical protein CTAYLR_008698 [Chrysophaeum taylorii]|uniref:Sacsin/Nov domain-containing protein n=1 Tax=Chrysophaeum taylorii TaxID=2483200 RepID=A0AAD7UJW9_9STRA|nr:hypothetical protein CTAYLR_008698 [Chrysophaeum taylorii]
MQQQPIKSFGQVSPLTTTLRNVLRDYGQAQVLNEQLQNADDAKATEVRVVLDETSYGRSTVATRELARWQGPALCFWDDAEFTATDLDSIQLVGDGKKRGDPTKTGQFGLGFNSVYHLTDVPSFLTGDKLVIFDPHAAHGIGTGAMFEPSDAIADQLAPFAVFGRGTFFRLPLRDGTFSSKIKKRAMSVEECWSEVVEPFLDHLNRRLLFLRSVRKVSVYRKEEARLNLVATASARVAEGSNVFWDKLLGMPYETAVGHLYDKTNHYRVVLDDDAEEWLISTAFGSRQEATTGIMMPYAAVAAPLFDEALVGLVYATLPTPIAAGLPVHVDGRFELARDRNALRVDVAGPNKKKKKRQAEDAVRADWNKNVMSRVAALAYARALIVDDRVPLPAMLSDDDCAHFGAQVARALYRNLVHSNAAVFSSLAGGQPQRVGARDALFIVRDDDDDDDIVAEFLAAAGCALVRSPKYFEHCLAPCLKECGLEERALSPRSAARWLRDNDVRPFLRRGRWREWCHALLPYLLEEDDIFGLPVVATRNGVVDLSPELLLRGDPALVDLFPGPLADERCSQILADRCRVLSPLDAVEANLPKDWRGRSSVVVDPANDASWEFVRRFWKVARRDDSLGEWPLVPCAGRELARLDRLALVLLPKDGAVDNQAEEDLAIAALGGLGVLVADREALDSWAPLADATASLSCRGVVDAIARLAPLPEESWAFVGAAGRDAILDVVSRDVDGRFFSEEFATRLSNLPIFPYVDGSRGPMSEDRFYANPRLDDLPLLPASSSERLLRAPRGSRRTLYEKLGARESAVCAFWLSRLDDLERWHIKLDVADRVEIFRRLRRDLEVANSESCALLREQGLTFGEWLGTRPLLWGTTSSFSIKDALDPAEPLHATFWPGRLVPPELPLDDWRPFLLRIGMRSGVSRDQLLEAARRAELAPLKARLVVETLFRYAQQQPRDDDDDDLEWLAEIGKLRIAESRYELPRGLVGAAGRTTSSSGSKQPRLVPFSGNVLPVYGARREHYSSWSQLVVVASAGITPRIAVVRALGAFPGAPLHAVARHLLYLVRHKDALADLDDVDFRDLDDDDDEDGLHRAKWLPLANQIGFCYESLGFLTTTTRGGDVSLSDDLIRDSPVVLLRRRKTTTKIKFVRPSQVFVGLSGEEDAPPFSYGAEERTHDDFVAAVKRYPSLVGGLGCRSGKPTLEQIKKWAGGCAQPISTTGEEEEEDDEMMTTAVLKLARLAHKLYQCDDGELFIPDASRALRRAEDTLYDDAPWLEGRVDKAKLPLVHPDLERKVAEALGSQPLSQRIVEVPAGLERATPPDPESRRLLATWEANLRSPAFAASLRRAAQRDTTTSVFAKRVRRLRAAELIPARALRSRFAYRDVDCTGSELGSLSLVADEDGVVKIYILAADQRPGWRRRWKAALAIAIDRYLDRAVGDRALVGELLSVDDAEEMAHVLDAYEVPLGDDLDMRVGTPVVLGDDEELVEILEGEDFSVGDLVVFETSRARVVEKQRAADDVVVLAVSPDLADTVRVPRTSLRRVARKQAPQPWFDDATERAARLAIREREATAQIEAEPAGIDDVKYLPSSSSTGAGGATAPSSVVQRERRSPGFDLVRAGNFARAPGKPEDIIFFHHRLTLHELYDEATHGRQRLVKECCGILDDVASVFGYDAAKVALFFQRGVVSRFVRQKLFFNLAPVDEHKRKLSLADARRDAFTYCYFWGLFVHKLAHFFDVVHGTRHDFFQTEYRCHFALLFIQLLVARGFDPAAVERDYGHLIHREVF